MGTWGPRVLRGPQCVMLRSWHGASGHLLSDFLVSYHTHCSLLGERLFTDLNLARLATDRRPPGWREP